VATADLYPQFSLFGTLAVSAVDAVTFIASGNVTYSFGPQFSWNLFAGGSIRSNIDAQDALTRQALLQYENTVLQAVEETENSMTAYVQERDRKGALTRSVTAAQEAVKLVETLYRTGLTDFNNVLNTQAALFEQQDQLAESEGDVTQNLIGIYKALGGGWSP
jgi:outer membrane protein TolC